MGQVWRAEHMSLGSMVAVKLVDVASSPNPKETMARFLHEARAAASIKHSNIVQTLDHGSEGHVAYIVMELLEGVSLAKRLEQLRVLPVADTVRIFREIGRALEKAHAQGIVHRDLKPENVFLANEDDREVVKLLDFGIAKTSEGGTDPHLKTQVGTVVGTPSYMSPEQVLGRPLDYRSDLWQIAMIAFECVTGTRAFSGASLGELFMRICSAPLPIPSQIANVPAGFDAWFARAAQRDPNARFQSIRELVDTLAQMLLRSFTGGAPATVPLGAMHVAEFLDPPAPAATLSTNTPRNVTPGNVDSTKRTLTITLAVLPILLIGAVGAALILSGRSGVSPTPETSASPHSANAPSATSPTTPTQPELVPSTGMPNMPADMEDAGPGSMQNTVDGGNRPKFVNKKKKDDVLGF